MTKIKNENVSLTYKPSWMGNFRAKVLKKRRKGSQTPGSTKGVTCKADTLDKFMAKRSRSYKHPLYGDWCKKCDKYHGRRRTA